MFLIWVYNQNTLVRDSNCLYTYLKVTIEQRIKSLLFKFLIRVFMRLKEETHREMPFIY